MANNQSIQFLRGTAARKAAVGSSTTLLAGQPFFETDTNRLYIGDGSKTLGTLSAISAYYDTVISTQEGFEAWYAQLDAGTYTGSSVLLLDGEYTRSDGKGLRLPPTLKKLHGSGGVNIKVTELAGSYPEGEPDYGNLPFAIGYDTVPSENDCSIENINVYHAGSFYIPSVGFRNCTNLKDCNCVHPQSIVGYAAVSFYNCKNLINCGKNPIENSVTCETHFRQCSNLINCFGEEFRLCSSLTNCHDDSATISISNVTDCTDLTNCRLLEGAFSGCTSMVNCYAKTTHATASFSSCTNLTNCRGRASGGGGGTNISAFVNCINLSNCIGSGHGDDGSYMTGIGYAFYSCTGCTNCRQDPDNPSRSGTWGGTNTNVDPNTCPEYKA